MTIGELAKAAAVPTSTIRFYERRGLIAKPPRTRAGYRSYGDRDVDRVRFLRRAAELGFTLEELGLLLQLSRGAGLRRERIAKLGAAKLADLDARIADLSRVRGAILGLLAEPCIDPAAPCPIVAALAGRPSASAGLSRTPVRETRRRLSP